MRPFRRLIVVPVLLVAVAAGACGSTSRTTAVSVGGVDYSESALRSDLANTIVDGTAPAAGTTDWLNTWIFFTAVGLEMADRDIVPTDAQIETAEADLASQDPAFTGDGPGAALRIEQWSIRVAAVEWAADAFPDAPMAEPDFDNPPKMLCSNHILVETEAEGLDILARLEAGEEFAALATDLSLDAASGRFGGALGCVVEGALVAEFEDAAYQAADGEVVGPVQSAFGFHLIEVLSAGPATADVHPTVDPSEIESAVQSEAQAAQADAQAEVDSLRASLLEDIQRGAILEFAEDVTVSSQYGTWDADQFLLLGPGDPTGG